MEREADGFGAVARAVLYEGYRLYPYRASALKNRQRWNFGTLYPPGYGEVAAGRERSGFRLECLVESRARPRVELRLCFLRGAGETAEMAEEQVEGALPEEDGEIQRREAGGLACAIAASAERLGERLWRLRVACGNATPISAETGGARAAALAGALHSAHLRCRLAEGEAGEGFVSAQDPPAGWAAEAAACRAEGVYPVLVGEPGARDRLLASALVLEDWPRVAAESGGDFFDATEMDEMLSLRVRTLSEAEKAELRAEGGRAAEVLERAEGMGAEELARLHGRGAMAGGAEQTSGRARTWALLEAAPAARVAVRGRWLGPGARVRLWPRGRADIFDLALRGKLARIQAVEQDVEGGMQVAVVVETDPGRDLGEQRQSGHRFFFRAEELAWAGEEERESEEEGTCGAS